MNSGREEVGEMGMVVRSVGRVGRRGGRRRRE